MATPNKYDAGEALQWSLAADDVSIVSLIRCPPVIERSTINRTVLTPTGRGTFEIITTAGAGRTHSGATPVDPVCPAPAEIRLCRPVVNLL